MTRKQPFTIEEFEFIYSRVPRVTVDLVIRSSRGILLTLRQKHGWLGQWHLPGGTIYLGEKVLDTVHRVAEEEVGLKLEVEKFLGYNEFPSESKERGYGYSIALVFLCRPLSENVTLDHLAEDFDFFETLPEKMIAEQKEFLLKNLL